MAALKPWKKLTHHKNGHASNRSNDLKKVRFHSCPCHRVWILTYFTGTHLDTLGLIAGSTKAFARNRRRLSMMLAVLMSHRVPETFFFRLTLAGILISTMHELIGRLLSAMGDSISALQHAERVIRLRSISTLQRAGWMKRLGSISSLQRAELTIRLQSVSSLRRTALMISNSWPIT